MHQLATGKICETCGSFASADMLSGFCPGCLLNTVLETQTDSSTGSRIEDYELLNEVARGGMGIVYRARQGAPARIVALKMVLPAHLHSRGAIDRFRAEAEAAASLDHEGILPIYAVSRHDGAPFYSMKFAEGGALSARLDRYRERPRGAAALIAKLARAVAHAHDHGILHRDLKPANVLFDAADKPYVADFGLAKWLAREGDLTQTLGVLGTPYYMAPEQATNSRTVTAAADVYSLGAILYHLLSGRPPISGDTPMEILHRTATETPKPPRLTNSRIPRDLETICLKCLEKEPAARYQNADGLADDLERFGAGQTVRARPAGLTTHAWRWTRRNPALAVLGLATSALLAGLLFFVSHREAKPGGKASLAVLPFEILTSDGAARTFADGLQNDLLVTLSKISQLQVIARSSVQRYAEHPHDVDRIGRELGVGAIAEGRLTVTGDRTRLNMQLVDTKTGRQIWSENYDRKIADVFALQGELALQIASALKAKLSPAESATLLRAPTTNPQAYLHCVEANELFRRYEKRRPDLERAEQLYEEALQLDPAFALAMAQASQVQVLMQGMYDPTSARLEKARTLMEKALQLQPELPEAHFAAGRYYGHGEFSRPGIDYEHGYREYLVALQSMPNSSDLHDAMGKLCRHLGRWAEAISHFERAAALDPNSAEGWHRLFDVQLATRNYAAAAEALDRAIAVAPNNPAFPYHRAWLEAHWKGDPSALRTWLSRFKGRQDDEQIAARIETGMFLREYAEPERLIALESIEPGVNEPLHRAAHALQVATLYLRTGRILDAQHVILETLPPLEELTRRPPQNAEALLLLAKMQALLGHNEEALRLATHATQLVPADRDAWFGPDVLLGLAEVHMLTGDNAKAVRLLEQLFTLATDVHRGSLRLNPRWDPLRNDSQFQKLLEK